jgi:hypothetical protein
MQIIIEEKKHTTINIELPAYYRQQEVFLYKILSERSTICVTDHESHFGISKSDLNRSGVIDAITKGTRITEEEFTNAFTRVAENVKRELLKSLETDFADRTIAQIK